MYEAGAQGPRLCIVLSFMKPNLLGLMILDSLFLFSGIIVYAQQGVPPSNEWSCPASHPIKGNLTTRSGVCIYHVFGGQFYNRTKPEICFTSVIEAQMAGCRKSKR
jgi:hypothetical protein